MSGQACNKCANTCATCKTDANTCTSCGGSKYLLGTSCVDSSGCGNGKYADPQSNTCAECGIADCTACKYNTTVSKPQCTACTSQKMIKTEVDGTTTCVDAAGCATDNQAGSHFLSTNSQKCILCNDKSDTSNQGIEGCGMCKKASASDANPTCTACIAGYYNSAPGSPATCAACGANCATCTQAGDDKCDTCKPGYFLKTSGTPGQCFACDDANNQGVEGCAQCNGGATPTCTKCKPNYRENSVRTFSCTKICEDPTACGGTAGSCKAAVLDDKGAFHYYCSLCGDPTTFPINGLCTKDNGDNTCTNGVCTQCAAGYFLYMGGCYSTANAPGSLMCTAAPNGICTAAANSRYFLVPGATKTDQSVLGCGNPLGTTTGTGDTAKAYVGIQGCKTCTAPSEASSAGMATAKCTACDGSKKPTSSGYGCVTCDTSDCKSCVADEVCGECTDSYYLKTEGSKTSCVRKEACTGGYFPKDESTGGNKCVQCSSASDGGITDCSECSLLPSVSRSSATLVTCTKCGSDKYLKADGSGCVDDASGCTPSTEFAKADPANGNKCLSCGDETSGVPNCAKCTLPSGAAKPTCSECSNNKIVKTDKGVTSCIEEADCTKAEGFFIDTTNGKKCTACSENCKTCSGAAAQCTSCKTDTPYLKKADGLQTGTCVNAADCTNGNTYYADDIDPKTCKSCAEGVSNCKTCTKDSGSNTVTCSACLEGFFVESKSTCTVCADSNCAVCDGGADQCSKCKDSFNLEGGKCMPSSTNRSDLSTGAIAGISVAVVVVVGGLVDFLCW
ncbi:Variant-specific surface protein [Giardia duodenalis]|uniref:Variant-specific surface protein n=1 Tax=Giardia intestinalis TaxID=5741 RepID=V6TQV8_GIAIN|nr:Variant-specific surface protein [Giardia intestinalis]